MHKSTCDCTDTTTQNEVDEFATKFIADNPGLFPSIDQMETTIHNQDRSIEELQRVVRSQTDRLIGKNKEIDKLKSEIATNWETGQGVFEGQATEIDRLKAEVSRLGINNDELVSIGNIQSRENDTLTERVEELEVLWTENNLQDVLILKKELDELRNSTDLAISAASDFEKLNDTLSKNYNELEDYESLQLALSKETIADLRMTVHHLESKNKEYQDSKQVIKYLIMEEKYNSLQKQVDAYDHELAGHRVHADVYALCDKRRREHHLLQYNFESTKSAYDEMHKHALDLEKQNKELNHKVGSLALDLENLELKLSESEGQRSGLESRLIELESAELQQTPTKLIKQTWSPIGPNSTGLANLETREACDNYKSPNTIAVLRRDTFQLPDGSMKVECELERV